VLVPPTVHLWGEALCLDYANSVSWSPEDAHLERARPARWVRTTGETDLLRSGDMLGRWGRRLGLLGDDAKQAPEPELRRARALRGAVHRVFTSISHDRDPPTEDIALLMHDYGEAVNQATLAAGERCYQLDWPAQDPRRLRYVVATDAIGLLRDPERLTRLSQCPGRGCGWLFLNLSGRRRWCSMSTCGSREKMRRLHERRKRHGG
jgi:predicted RNA-binding Zn ribbon-like protein